MPRMKELVEEYRFRVALAKAQVETLREKALTFRYENLGARERLVKALEDIQKIEAQFSETMTIRVSSEMKAKVAGLAKAERRSASQMAVILLEEALEARGRQKG